MPCHSLVATCLWSLSCPWIERVRLITDTHKGMRSCQSACKHRQRCRASLDMTCIERQAVTEMPHLQLLKSERNLSQYTIGRGSTSLKKRLSSRHRSLSAPAGGLIPVSENGPAPLNDWRQRFVEVRPAPCTAHPCRSSAAAPGGALAATLAVRIRGSGVSRPAWSCYAPRTQSVVLQNPRVQCDA